MSVKKFLLVTVFVLCCTTAQRETVQCSRAIATFDGTNGVTGTVEIDEKGQVSVNLDATDLDASLCTDGGIEFAYHIHNVWEFDDFTPRFEDECGAAYTGGKLCFVFVNTNNISTSFDFYGNNTK